MKKKVLFFIIFIILIASLAGILIYMVVKEDKNNNKKTTSTTTTTTTTKVVDPYQDLKDSKYYIANNFDRYVAYMTLYPDKDMAEVVKSVNSNIDYEFYTNTFPAKLEEKELMLVNKFSKLEQSYSPELVDMGSYARNTIFKYMEKNTFEHFKEMCDAAKLEGIILYNVSGYRSYSTQNLLYTNYVNRDGVAAADRYSARPGYSEHQTGMASDIITADSSDHFENTKEYAWLIANSYKYGFILRYPQGKEYITGYKYEPWHYRYVGVDAAKYIYENDITYEEYYAYFVNKN